MQRYPKYEDMIMTCQTIKQQLDDYIDGVLAAEEEAAIRSHLDACKSCALYYEEALQLVSALKDLPVEAPSADFTERVFTSVKKQQRRRRQKAVWYSWAGAALAAMIAWLLISVPVSHPPQQIVPAKAQSIAKIINLNETKDINLVVRAPQPLQGALITIMLPQEVSLAGHPEQREISWVTNLAQGKNLLTLPLVGSMKGEASIITRIDHQSKHRELKLKMQVRDNSISRQTSSALFNV